MAPLAVPMRGCSEIYTRRVDNGARSSFPMNEDGQAPIQDHLPKMDRRRAGARACATGRTCCKSCKPSHARNCRRAEQLNYDIYLPQIEALISRAAVPRVRDAGQRRHHVLDRPRLHRAPAVPNAADYRNWIAQMSDIPRYFHEQTDEMRAGLKRGFTPPQVTLEGRDASITAVTDATPEAEPVLYAFQGDAGHLGRRPGEVTLREAAAGDPGHRAARLSRTAEVHAREYLPACPHAPSPPTTCPTARLTTRPRSVNS